MTRYEIDVLKSADSLKNKVHDLEIRNIDLGTRAAEMESELIEHRQLIDSLERTFRMLSKQLRHQEACETNNRKVQQQLMMSPPGSPEHAAALECCS